MSTIFTYWIKMSSLSFATLVIVTFFCNSAKAKYHLNESLVLGRAGENISLTFWNWSSNAKICHIRTNDNHETCNLCDSFGKNRCNDADESRTIMIIDASSEDTGTYEIRLTNEDRVSHIKNLTLYDYKVLLITIDDQYIDLGYMEFLPNAPESLEITVKAKEMQLCKEITLNEVEDNRIFHSGKLYSVLCKPYKVALNEINNGTSLTFDYTWQGELLTSHMRKVSNVTIVGNGNEIGGEDEEPNSNTTITLIVVFIVVVILLLVIAFFVWRKRRKQHIPRGHDGHRDGGGADDRRENRNEDEGIELASAANTVNGPENESETEPLANGNPESVHDENADIEENTNIKILQNEHKRETDLQNEKGDMNEDITTGIMQDLKEDLLSVNEDHIPINTKVENASYNKNVPKEQRLEHQKKLAHREESNLRFNDELLKNALVQEIHLSKTVQMIPYDDEEQCSYKIKPNVETLTKLDREPVHMNENLVARPEMVIDEQIFEPRGNREIHPEVEQIDRSSSDELNDEDETVALNAENGTSESVCENETDQPNGKGRTCETMGKASTVETKDEVENAITKGKDGTDESNDEDKTSTTNDEVNADETRHTGFKYRDAVTGAIDTIDQAVIPTCQAEWKTQILPAYQQDYAFPQKIFIGGNIRWRDKSFRIIPCQQPTYRTGMRLLYCKPISRRKPNATYMDIFCV